MPLFYTHNINENTRLAVWYLDEDEFFFKRITIPQREISHPHKRLQHLAGRYLLKLMDSQFPVDNIILDGKRPYLTDNSYYFSISHCGDYAAAILSKASPVGIDVEIVTPRLEKLEKKFLNDDERRLIRSNNVSLSLTERLTACWSGKESMFKWYALGKVDFRKDMIIHSFSARDGNGCIKATFGKNVNKKLEIEFRFFDTLCLAWVK